MIVAIDVESYKELAVGPEGGNRNHEKPTFTGYGVAGPRRLAGKCLACSVAPEAGHMSARAQLAEVGDSPFLHLIGINVVPAVVILRYVLIQKIKH